MRDIVSPLSGFGSPFGQRRRDTLASVIAALFGNDEPGFWIDSDDWSTLFQDTAGRTPVTAPEQGVALALDKRLGLELGPELVTNDSGAVLRDVGVFRAIETGASAVAGLFYEVSFSVTRNEGQNFHLLRGSIFLVGVSAGVTGTFKRIITTTTGSLSFRGDQDNGVDADVANISIRELKGTHATQPTTAARPLTAVHPDGGVRTLLEQTENFADSYWTKEDITVSVSPEPSPAGSAFLVSETALSSFIKSLFPASSVTAGLTYTGSWVLKKATTSAAPDWVRIQFRTPGFGSNLQPRANINLATGELGFVANGTASVADLGDGWYRVSITGTANNTTSGNAGIGLFFIQNTNSDNTFVGGVGDVNAAVLAAAPQMEVSPTATPYQRRVNFLDVTEAGKRSIRRLYFNGTSHFMTTPTITPNTDKAQVFAGVRKLSDAQQAAVFSTGGISENGSLELFAPRTSGVNSRFGTRSSGTANTNTDLGGVELDAPKSVVLTMLTDIAEPKNLIRAAGFEGVNSASQGPGNYLAYQTFIGARNDTSNFFNGFLDQLITRFGANLDTATIEKTEKYVSTKVPEVPTL